MVTNNDNKTLNVPPLRFPEFTGDWKECRIKDFGDIVTGNTPPTKNLKYYEDGERLWASPADLGVDKIVSSTKTKLSNKGFEKTRKLPAGSILVTCIGSTIGKMGMANEEMSTNQQINSIVTNDYTNNNFAYYSILSAFPRYLSEVAIQAVPILSKSNFERLLNHSTAIDEQNKIGNFLSLLDDRIATQIKIIEDLKKLKSAISKRLFTRIDLLELRITLSNISTLKNGYAFQSRAYNSEGQYNIITIANVSGERFVNQVGCNRILAKPVDLQQHQELNKEDILISLTGNVGRVSLCSEGNCLLNQRVGLLQINNGVNREFVFQTLSHNRFEQTMISCAQGAAQMNIGKNNVEDYVIPYSNNVSNIDVIASTLKAYDDSILLERCYLSLLHHQKQYLLAQMFI